MLSSSEGYVSGSKLSAELGVSRATVNRLIRELIKDGYHIEIHPKLGYRLVEDADLSALNSLLKDLGTSLRFYAHFLPVCSSTQDVAESLALQGAEEGTIVIAEKMEQGRGRLRRRWLASEGGLWFSMILRPPFVKNLQLITLLTGVSVAASIRKSFGLEARLKWPNDVLLNGKKVGGVLVEGKIESDSVHYIIVGIGVNVNNELPPELRETATSIHEALGVKAPRARVLIAILKEFDARYSLLLTGKGKEIVDEWKGLSETLNKRVMIITENERVEGVALDVLEDGTLLVKTGEGELREIYAGDVVHLR